MRPLYLTRRRPTQRCEAEVVPPLVRQDEAHGGVAERAVTIKEQKGTGLRHVWWGNSRGGTRTPDPLINSQLL